VNDPLARLAARIRDEVDDIEEVINRAEEGWQRYQVSGDDYYSSILPIFHP
jgi:hypothetical protein